jgi:ribosome-associated protein
VVKSKKKQRKKFMKKKLPPRKAKAKKTVKPVRKIAAKKIAARKTAARKTAARKTAARKTAARKMAARLAPSRRPAGIPERMRDAALKVLEDRQAEDVVTFDLAGRSSVADYLIIASGRAARQIAAIAHYLREAFVAHGARQPRVEGLPEANWVLVDGGDVIVHLFRPEVRRYYQLEEIWMGRRKAG